MFGANAGLFHNDLLKIGRAVLAPGADEIGGQLLALVFVAADPAAPHGLFRLGRPGLHVGVIKGVSHAGHVGQHGGYLTETVNLAELFSEELDGLRPSFERIKIPAGGGLAYEVPGDDPASPDSAKEFSAVIPPK